MAKSAWLGNKVRRIRRERGVAQIQLARELGISPSYLNMIERSQRPITRRLLGKLSEVFGVDISELSGDHEARLLSNLIELFSDPALAPNDVSREEVEELIAATPAVARVLPTLYLLYRNARSEVDYLRERMTDEDFLSTSAHELRSALTPIRSFAEILHDHENIGRAERHHFAGILARESERLAEIIGRMLSAAAIDGGAAVQGSPVPGELVNEFIESNDNYFASLEEAATDLRRAIAANEAGTDVELLSLIAEHSAIEVVFSPEADQQHAVESDWKIRQVVIPEALPPASRTFAALKFAARVLYADEMDACIPENLRVDPAVGDLCRNYLSAYLAGAVMMPYEPFLDAVRKTRYDIDRLQRRFHASFEQVCHRATTLQRVDAKGVPLHFVRVDIAGNISKRFSRSGFRIPRYGGLCPRLNVHTAFMTPGRYLPQVARMPGGATFFSIARTVTRFEGVTPYGAGHYSIMLGCDLSDAEKFVHADAINLKSEAVVTAAGVSCRLCDRLDCAQRVHPPVLRSVAPPTGRGASAASGA